jgi:hypothetical protein
VIDLLPGPLAKISRQIEARLKVGLPPEKFTYRWLPAKMDAKVWDMLIQRCPAISLEYVGFKKAVNTSGLIGVGIWNVWLAVKNARSAEDCLFGDTVSPHGAMIVHQVAMLLLHGMRIKGAGTMTVVEADPVAFLERDNPDVYVVRLTVQVEQVTITAASLFAGDITAAATLLDGDIQTMGTLLTEQISWTFGSGDAVAQVDLDRDNITNTGTA